MSLTTDISLDSSKFHPDRVTKETKEANAFIKKFLADNPGWRESGPAKFREMVERGETAFPVPVYLPDAKDIHVPSRDAGRDTTLRVIEPDNGVKSRGLFMFIHGGGFIMGSYKHSDSLLKTYANECQMTVIAVKYRLAPEDTFPAAVHDCFDAAEYLVDHGEEVFGAKLLVICGDSAGGNFAASTAFQLMRSRPTHRLAAMLFVYGYFDQTLNMPGASLFRERLVLNVDDLQTMTEYFTPGMSITDRRNPLVSPLYDDLQALASSVPSKSLPPALFLCGTEDPLLDDTVMMSTKWMRASGEAVVKIYPGAAHGFITFPGYQAANEGKAAIFRFVREKLDAVA